MRLKIFEGNTSYECAWIVKFASHKHNFEPIAEFWDRKDAMLFKKVKAEQIKFDKQERTNQ